MNKKITLTFGWLFIVLGVLGFISNPVIGAHGFFLTNASHNVIHLLSGIVFLWVAYSAKEKAGSMLRTFGIVYLIITILGFISSLGKILGFIATNTPANWLHLVMALIFIWVGYMSGMDKAPMPIVGQQM